jgi:hypothetical protein
LIGSFCSRARSFRAALRLAGLEAPAFKRGSVEYRRQVGERYLDLLVLGMEHRDVGSGRWYVWPLGGAPEGAEPL